MKKFGNRRVLFKEILSEIYKFHLNYKEELNKLNINIKQIITQHSNKLQTGVAKRTLSKSCYKVNVTLILKTDKYITRQGNYKPRSSKIENSEKLSRLRGD